MFARTRQSIPSIEKIARNIREIAVLPVIVMLLAYQLYEFLRQAKEEQLETTRHSLLSASASKGEYDEQLNAIKGLRIISSMPHLILSLMLARYCLETYSNQSWSRSAFQTLFTLQLSMNYFSQWPQFISDRHLLQIIRLHPSLQSYLAEFYVASNNLKGMATSSLAPLIPFRQMPRETPPHSDLGVANSIRPPGQ